MPLFNLIQSNSGNQTFYFTSTSSGSSDAGKAILLNSQGEIDNSLLAGNSPALRVTYDSVAQIALFELEPNQLVETISIYVSSIWNTTDSSITVGSLGNQSLLVNSNDIWIDFGTGEYEVNPNYINNTVNNIPIYLFLNTASGTTQGELYIKWQLQQI